jgi:hypothetical protein
MTPLNQPSNVEKQSPVKTPEAADNALRNINTIIAAVGQQQVRTVKFASSVGHVVVTRDGNVVPVNAEEK